MGSNQIRIVGGLHRGRRLRFADLPGLRPSGDRVRETLFNWLQPIIEGARCLDLFAGSGALGLEAASRGAAQVVMVDRSSDVIRQLRENVHAVGLAHAEVVRADALQWLGHATGVFDVVFLDPPFADDLLPEACRLLLERRCLKRGGMVYLEADAGTGLPALPQALAWHRQKHMGRVAFGLACLA